MSFFAALADRAAEERRLPAAASGAADGSVRFTIQTTGAQSQPFAPPAVQNSSGSSPPTASSRQRPREGDASREQQPQHQWQQAAGRRRQPFSRPGTAARTVTAGGSAGVPSRAPIRSWQLQVLLHESTYGDVFPDVSDVSGYEYKVRDPERIEVKWLQPQQHLRQQRWQQPKRPRGAASGTRDSSRVEVRDEHLVIPEASTARFLVSLDRRLRPTVLATHQRESCPLPLLGLVGDSRAFNTAAAGATGATVITAAAESHKTAKSQDIQELEHALQAMVRVIRREGLLPNAIAPAGGWRDSSCSGGDMCGIGSRFRSSSGTSSTHSSDASKDEEGDLDASVQGIRSLSIRNSSSSTSSASSTGSGGDGLRHGGATRASVAAAAAPPPLPPPLLTIHESEGQGWRRSRRIHLKAFVGGGAASAQYVRLLQELLRQNGVVMTNQNNDPHDLTARVQEYRESELADYAHPALAPIVSNFQLLDGTTQKLLESRTDLYFRVQDEQGQLAAGNLRAVWYGCRGLPRLVATLPGKAVNGLSLGEALACMRAFWESDLKKRVFESVKGPAGLTWVLVPYLQDA